MPKKLKNTVKKPLKSDGDAPSKFMLDLDELKHAESRKEFQLLLSEIIWKVPQFSYEELDRLSKLIKTPPSFPSGPKFKTSRDIEILEEHFVLKEGVSAKPRKLIIAQIIEKYRVTHDTAAKIYNRLRPKSVAKKGNNSD